MSARKKATVGKSKHALPPPPRSPSSIAKDVESFVDRQLAELRSLRFPWPAKNLEDWTGEVIWRVLEEMSLELAKKGITSEADADVLLNDREWRAPIIARVFAALHKNPHPKYGPDLKLGRFAHLDTSGDELPSNMSELMTMTAALLGIVESKLADDDSTQRFLAKTDFSGLWNRRRHLVRQLERANEIRGHREFWPTVAYIIRLTVAYTRCITSMELAPEFTKLMIQRGALRQKKTSVKFDERLKVVRLNTELTKTLSKSAIRYREIAKRLDMSSARVRYIIEGPRRKKRR